MRADSRTFFRDLLDAAGPSGDERAAAAVWRDYASGFADVRGDALGSAVTPRSTPSGTESVAVLGHIDEIGLVVTHIDDEGYLWFAGVGGWVAAVLVAQRIRILAKDGPVPGVVGQKAPHLTDQEERDKPLQGRPALDRHRRRRRRRRPARACASATWPWSSSRSSTWAAAGSPAARSTTAPARSSPPRPARLYAETARDVAARRRRLGLGGDELRRRLHVRVRRSTRTRRSSSTSPTRPTSRTSPSARSATSSSAAAPSSSAAPACIRRMFELIGEVAERRGHPATSSAAAGPTWTDADAVKLTRRGHPARRRQRPEPLHALAERDRRPRRPRGRPRPWSPRSPAGSTTACDLD